MDPLLLPKSSVKALSDDEEEDSRHDNSLSLLNNNNNNNNNHAVLRQEQEETWSLRVKSIAKQDVSILVRPRDTVAAVKAAVRQALGPDVTSNRPYTRLVCKGRLLAPDAAKLKDLTVVQPNDVLHAVLSASAPREGPQAALQRGLSQDEATATQEPCPTSSSTSTSTSSSTLAPGRRRTTANRRSRGPSRRAWRGAGINANGLAVRQTADSDTDEEEDATTNDDDDSADVEHGAGTVAYMGFDRLRRAGLRRSDVVALRTYFGRSIDRFVRQNPEQTTFATETDAVRRRLLQEEAWMAAQGPLSEFRLNVTPMAPGSNGAASWTAGAGGNAAAATRGGLSPSEALWRSGGLSAAVGTDRDFIWGFLLGFLVGLLMLVWVWMPSVPHKQKLGILTGISFQLALSMLRTSNGVDDANRNPHQYPLYEGDDYFFHD